MSEKCNKFPTLQEAFNAAIVAHRAQGLELSAFGLEIGAKVVQQEITTDEAVKIILEHYRKSINHM